MNDFVLLSFAVASISPWLQVLSSRSLLNVTPAFDLGKRLTRGPQHHLSTLDVGDIVPKGRIYFATIV